MNLSTLGALLICGVLVSVPMRAQEPEAHEKCTHESSQSEASHHQAMMSRGEKGMGFSQTATTHHFLLKPDGGTIAVVANDAGDKATCDQIRMHLAHIAHAFAAGNFEIPMFVHDQVPPGIEVMKRRASEIQYQFHETENGGEVAISSTSAEVTRAIHDFLVFQIREHKTNDPTVLPSK